MSISKCPYREVKLSEAFLIVPRLREGFGWRFHWLVNPINPKEREDAMVFEANPEVIERLADRLKASVKDIIEHRKTDYYKWGRRKSCNG